ncbi:MAG: hypothetical protein UY48_C0004G0008 [Candidatus Gottesmanbacteria bacterium GW2011_GWB1_49_7]|uniref:Uncharacterized protein n=1 Tax=Candidatus Gottesmanbacteria bacterium GW2011_GWB1_49_7 TaxID=1618448 RepID=A0A0G1W367_9BACT|nr:MAG: hypothetical protein UY48_C0004G0008 [Candidatus Gottesmanbacteria bacterium GW2011_GWB1_49_7]
MPFRMVTRPYHNTLTTTTDWQEVRWGFRATNLILINETPAVDDVYIRIADNTDTGILLASGKSSRQLSNLSFPIERIQYMSVAAGGATVYVEAW